MSTVADLLFAISEVVAVEAIRQKKAAALFALVLVFTGIASGFGNNIISNYFSEAFLINSVQRGFIEIPRESPGILCMLLVSALGFLGNLRMAVVSQILLMIGLGVLGFCTPTYNMMLVFLFIQSMGMHFFMPLNDAISMELSQKGKVGTGFGKFKGVTTLVSMITACIVFVGFRAKWFSFTTPVILPFAIGAISTGVAAVLLIMLYRMLPEQGKGISNHRLLFRREYMPYYMVTLAYGCQKRIKLVFAPWVIIQLLGQGADTVALLTIVTHLAGTWAAPWIGRMLDKLGVRKMLWMEAVYILLSFGVMGALAGMLASGRFAVGGWLTWLVFASYVLCVLFEQFNLVHSFMMRSIARAPEEVTQTLSVGVSVDHIMAIIASPILGVIWESWGVQYVFYLSALSAVLQLIAAGMVKEPVPEA